MATGDGSSMNEPKLDYTVYTEFHSLCILSSPRQSLSEVATDHTCRQCSHSYSHARQLLGLKVGFASYRIDNKPKLSY